MDKLMQDLGVNNYDELLQFMKDNPGNETVIELKKILSLVEQVEKNEK
ncbi:TPA: hypothetical protein ACGOX3_001791 [Streptococcus suis]